MLQTCPSVIFQVSKLSFYRIYRLIFSTGLIASVGASGKESDIALVKGLVTSYIEKESCIILLTVACESES